MLLLNLLFIAIASQTFVAAAPKRKATDEHIAAVFVKDSENGQLRFLTSTNSVNQLITQKQDLLEELRPSNGNNNNITPIYIDLNGGTTSTTSTSPTLTTSNSNSAILAAAASSSAPIGALLPQIVGQAVAGGPSRSGTGTGSTSRFRRGGNKRRRVNVNSNKRRRRRRPANKNQRKPQVVLLRPQLG